MLLRGLKIWQMGIKSLLLHPMRSALTVLGIFVGVASVIWLLAIGEGISLSAQKQIEQLGADNVIVRTVKPPDKNASKDQKIIAYGITRADFELLEETIPTIVRIVPIREISRRFSYHGRFLGGRLVGCTPKYYEINHLEIDRGRFLTDSDLFEKKNLCVLAAGTAAELFSFENPIGKAVRVDNQYYVVIGVTKHRNPSAGIGGSFSGQDFNNDVYIPISTLWNRIGDFISSNSGDFPPKGDIVELSQITIQVDQVDHVVETSTLVKDMLARHHKKDDFAVTIPLELLEQARTTRMMFILFMGLIAAISLLVGGIGIMNIMLATVTERTREIGIRRALGAKRRDIIRQFLIETVSLSVLGGLTGILGGLTCRPVTAFARYLLNRAIPEVVEQLPELIQSVEPIIVPESIPLAFGISVTIGVLFGIYPAMRAAAMDPIEALRHE